MDRPLHRLFDIHWSELEHAYGDASDVPSQIVALASDDAKTRQDALWELYGNIYHQGSRYEATPYAVPFLYELIADPFTESRHEIILLLTHLALGFPEYFLPGGISAQVVQNVSESLNESVEAQCYHAVSEGVPTLLELLNDEDANVRAASTYALAWFPSHAPLSTPAIRNLLTTETEIANTATAVLALGLLARSSGIESDDSEIRGLLSHDSLMLRTAAAIALFREPIEKHVLDILIEAVGSSNEFETLSSHVLFNNGDVVGYVSMILAEAAAAGSRELIIPVLCKALKSAHTMQSLDLTKAILDNVINVNSHSNDGESQQAFDALETDALLAIADYGAWEVGGGTFVNYCDLVRAYGLPGSKMELVEYVRSNRKT